MSTNPFIDQVLSLPLEERIGLAEALWQSIGEDLATGDEKEAVREAFQREAELKSGISISRTHEEVMQAALRAIGCK